MLHHSTMRDHSTVAYMDQLMCTGESYCTFFSNVLWIGIYYVQVPMMTKYTPSTKLYWECNVNKSREEACTAKQTCRGSLLGPKWNSHCVLKASFYLSTGLSGIALSM